MLEQDGEAGGHRTPGRSYGSEGVLGLALAATAPGRRHGAEGARHGRWRPPHTGRRHGPEVRSAGEPPGRAEVLYADGRHGAEGGLGTDAGGHHAPGGHHGPERVLGRAPLAAVALGGGATPRGGARESPIRWVLAAARPRRRR